MIPKYIEESFAKEDAALKALTDYLDLELVRVEKADKQYKALIHTSHYKRKQYASI